VKFQHIVSYYVLNIFFVILLVMLVLALVGPVLVNISVFYSLMNTGKYCKRFCRQLLQCTMFLV